MPKIFVNTTKAFQLLEEGVLKEGTKINLEGIDGNIINEVLVKGVNTKRKQGWIILDIENNDESLENTNTDNTPTINLLN